MNTIVLCAALLLGLQAVTALPGCRRLLSQSSRGQAGSFSQRNSCPFSSAQGFSGGSDAPGPFDLAAFDAVDFRAVKEDIKKLLTNSQSFWPADFGNYGGLMIRQAWHCAGTYRTSDGRGGCDGARQRFDPEESWDDNTNLDKSKKLLWPIKQKYGKGLSWGDLIALTGTTAIEAMGGPVLGFCAGRVDDMDGSASLELGPNPEQQAVAPCPVQGNCSFPLGASTMGLIYVNPAGPMGNPDPAASAPQIREVFARMALDDEETVALIGGGHAFGKAHGACPTGPGPNPDEDPASPWPGTCGSGSMMGKGNNTFTSGFEGPWSTTPTQWSNEYFKNLLDYDWQVHTGPGGNYQWKPVAKAGSSNSSLPQVMMLTTDVALTKDPAYLALVKAYAADLDLLNDKFSRAWYKLMTRDMGPASRCLGNDVPPPQPFQNPLPSPPSRPPSPSLVTREIRKAITSSNPNVQPDSVGSKPYYGALLAQLAWQCVSTFRSTDYQGGCNGARIRFSPEKDWPENVDSADILKVLEPIKSKYGNDLTYADLIVLAGQVAVEDAAGITMKFCPGRSDATDGSGSQYVGPRNYSNAAVATKDTIKVMGLTPREYVVLQGRPRSPTHQKSVGYSGSWTLDPSKLSNEYFATLLNRDWVKTKSASGMDEYVATDKNLYMTPMDMVIKYDPALLAIAQEFASDKQAFLNEFSAAWTKMMNADRFDGPRGNTCA